MDAQKPADKPEEELTEDEKRERKITQLEAEAWEFEKQAADFRNASKKKTLLVAAKTKRHEAHELKTQGKD